MIFLLMFVVLIFMVIGFCGGIRALILFIIGKDEPVKNNIPIQQYINIGYDEWFKQINSNIFADQKDTPTEIVIKDAGLDTSKLLNYAGEQKNIFKFRFRPRNFQEFIGQDNNINIIKTAIKGIKSGEIFHFFFYAKPGVGKTSLARIIASELNAEIIELIGKQITLELLVDTMNKFHNSNKKYCLLFLDEVETVGAEICKIMNPMIEDFKLNDKNLRPFIFIGCTINKNILIQRGNGDFLGRINYHIMFDKYTIDNILSILQQYIYRVYSSVNIDISILNIIAQNSRNEPRKAIHMLKHYLINKNINETIKHYQIIKDGLTAIDIRILQAINSAYPKTISASALSQKAGVNTNDYIQDIEPFLVEEGYIERPHKRIITTKGIKLLQSL